MGSVYYRSRISLHGWMAGRASEKRGTYTISPASFRENHITVHLSPSLGHPVYHMPSASHAMAQVPLLSTAAQTAGSFIASLKQNVPPPSHIWSVRVLDNMVHPSLALSTDGPHAPLPISHSEVPLVLQMTRKKHAYVVFLSRI